jgi:hypothetical protein
MNFRGLWMTTLRDIQILQLGPVYLTSMLNGVENKAVSAPNLLTDNRLTNPYIVNDCIAHIWS